MIAEPQIDVEYALGVMHRLRLNERSLILELGPRSAAMEQLAAHGPRVVRLETVDTLSTTTARRLRQEHGRADLIACGPDVFAAALATDSVVAAIHLFLAWNGTLMLDVPCPSPSSVTTVERMLEPHALRLFDLEPLPIGCGSVRLWGCHTADVRRVSVRLGQLELLES